jgi:hypothetical protein
MDNKSTYIPIETLTDKEFYKLVKIGHLSPPVKIDSIYPSHDFIAFDTRQRAITIASNPNRAYFTSVELGCDTPWVINTLYLTPKFYEEHNKRLEKALSK